MQARHADADGFVEHLGVKIHYEIHGDGGPTVLLLPTWTISHRRFWKMQLAYLARHYRVVTYDGPGNGRSDRPLDTAAYDQAAQVAYAATKAGLVQLLRTAAAELGPRGVLLGGSDLRRRRARG